MLSTNNNMGSQTANNGNEYSMWRKHLIKAFDTIPNQVGPFKVAFNPGNPTVVNDSSDYIRFKKLTAINNNFFGKGVPL
jgi:hypothetical protein